MENENGEWNEKNLGITHLSTKIKIYLKAVIYIYIYIYIYKRIINYKLFINSI